MSLDIDHDTGQLGESMYPEGDLVSYCDEHLSTDCDRYHEVFNCPECGAEDSVEIGPVSPNPESGDEALCEACGATWEA